MSMLRLCRPRSAVAGVQRNARTARLIRLLDGIYWCSIRAEIARDCSTRAPRAESSILCGGWCPDIRDAYGARRSAWSLREHDWAVSHWHVIATNAASVLVETRWTGIAKYFVAVRITAGSCSAAAPFVPPPTAIKHGSW